MNSTSIALSSDAIVFHLRLVGGIYFGMASVGLVLYMPCLYVMNTHEQLKRHTCYRMMRHLGYADVISLLTQISSGFVLMMGWQEHVPYWVNSIVGAIAQGLCWNPSVWFVHLIAINRCLQMTRPLLAEKLFGKRTVQGYSNGISNYLIAFVWINSLAIFACWASPYGNMVMNEETGYAWYYDYVTPKHSLMRDILAPFEMYFAHGSFILCACWYLGMVCGMRRLASDSTLTASHAKREREIVLQAFLICGGSSLCALYWEVAPWFGGRYKYVACNVMWIVTVLLNPVIYLCFNRTVRNSVVSIIRGEYSHGSITTAVNTPSMAVRQNMSSNTLLLLTTSGTPKHRSVSHQYFPENNNTSSSCVTKTSTVTLSVLPSDGKPPDRGSFFL